MQSRAVHLSLRFFWGLIFSLHFAGQVAHHNDGTSYTSSGTKAYAKSKHGPDGGKFLDPYFIPHISSLNGKKY
ncbi:MAG: hypothetical protein KC505_01750 [Myxococcales bacterium]|nr:hypothetical protein [Myxococcales bacterium]USN51470.1 MAG: hypothetical protein H6731_03420 [Myxococcales bacterium]